MANNWFFLTFKWKFLVYFAIECSYRFSFSKTFSKNILHFKIAKKLCLRLSHTFHIAMVVHLNTAISIKAKVNEAR